MAISVRPAIWSEVEEGLAIQPRNLGDDLVGFDATLRVWRRLFRQPFFACVSVETSSPIQGYRSLDSELRSSSHDLSQTPSWQDPTKHQRQVDRGSSCRAAGPG